MNTQEPCPGCGREECICGVISSSPVLCACEKVAIALMTLMIVGTIATLFCAVCRATS